MHACEQREKLWKLLNIANPQSLDRQHEFLKNELSVLKPRNLKSTSVFLKLSNEMVACHMSIKLVY